MVITNIPTPYRIAEFNALERTLRERGASLLVWFLSRTESDRDWRDPLLGARFDHRVCRAGRLQFGPNLPFHLGVAPVREALRRRPSWLLLGAMWYQPAIVLAALLARRQTVTLFWYEGENPYDVVGGSIATAAKRMLRRRVDGFVVPGKTARDRVAVNGRPVLTLRNVVDAPSFARSAERRVSDLSARELLGLSPADIVVMVPARLHPAKGLVPFLQAVPDDPQLVVVMAGNGPLRNRLESTARALLSTRVRFLGHLEQPELCDWYGIADLVALPSLRDPYGVVTIEAAWAALPLLLSNRVGAAPDILEPGKSGWLVDPDEPGGWTTALKEALSLGRDGLAALGLRSREIAESGFHPETASRRFVDELVTLRR